MKIYLDDIRVPQMSHNYRKGLGDNFAEDWVIVRNYDDFVDVVKKNFDEIDLISFDHDLGITTDIDEMSGKNAVDFIINYCIDNDKKFPNWYVHSDNVVGRENMISSILNYLSKMEKMDISSFRFYHKGLYNGKFI